MRYVFGTLFLLGVILPTFAQDVPVPLARLPRAVHALTGDVILVQGGGGWCYSNGQPYPAAQMPEPFARSRGVMPIDMHICQTYRNIHTGQYFRIVDKNRVEQTQPYMYKGKLYRTRVRPGAGIEAVVKVDGPIVHEKIDTNARTAPPPRQPTYEEIQAENNKPSGTWSCLVVLINPSDQRWIWVDASSKDAAQAAASKDVQVKYGGRVYSDVAPMCNSLPNMVAREGDPNAINGAPRSIKSAVSSRQGQ